MAYYFMVEKKKGEYQSLNIENVAGFHGQRKYTKAGAYTLQEIDMFTTMFNNEDELRNTLISCSVLPMNLANKPLSTRWVNKGKYNKVPYDFLYQKDLGYILEPYKLLDFIMDKYNQWDFIFIKKFADYFSMYRECSSTAPEVRMYADMSIREGACCRYLEDVDLNGDNQVMRLVKLLLFEYYENPNGRIDYKNKINYRNLHAMIAFINNYNKKIDGLVNVKTVSKTRAKKNDMSDQLSIFDLL